MWHENRPDAGNQCYIMCYFHILFEGKFLSFSSNKACQVTIKTNSKQTNKNILCTMQFNMHFFLPVPCNICWNSQHFKAGRRNIHSINTRHFINSAMTNTLKTADTNAHTSMHRPSDQGHKHGNEIVENNNNKNNKTLNMYKFEQNQVYILITSAHTDRRQNQHTKLNYIYFPTHKTEQQTL